MTGDDETFGGVRRLSPCLRSATGVSDFLEKVKAPPHTNEILSKDVTKTRKGRTEEPLTSRKSRDFTAYERDFFKRRRKDSDRTRGETADQPKKAKTSPLTNEIFSKDVAKTREEPLTSPKSQSSTAYERDFLRKMSQKFGIERAEGTLTSIFALPCPKPTAGERAS